MTEQQLLFVFDAGEDVTRHKTGSFDEFCPSFVNSQYILLVKQHAAAHVLCCLAS
jgi:hypothetical protein